MKTGQDHPFVIFLSLLQSLLAFHGWGFLPIGLLGLVLALKGCRLLPSGLLLWSVLMAALILFGEQRSQVHVLARHFTPLFVVWVLAVALVLGKVGKEKSWKHWAFLVLLLPGPLNLEIQHPRIWLMGLDLRSDFLPSLKELAREEEKPVEVVPLGFMDGLWTYVLKEEVQLLGLEKKVRVVAPGEWLRKEGHPSNNSRVVVFQVPPYLDPAKAPLSALGFPPPRQKGEVFGGYGQMFSVDQLKELSTDGTREDLLQVALLRLESTNQKMAKAAGQQNKVLGDMMRIGQLSARASLACRAGSPEWGELYRELAGYENTLRDLRKDFQRVTGVAFAQAMERCMARAGAPMVDRLRVLKLGADYLGQPSGALVVQSQWAAAAYYRRLQWVAHKTGDRQTENWAKKRAKSLKHLPHIAPWP